MFKSSDPKLPFYVANHQELNNLDQQVLLKLYQPIIGALATSVYLTLNDQISQIPIKSDFSRLSFLQDQLDVDLQALFVALHKLEATVLIKSFTNENQILGQTLIFEIQPVLTPKEFFETFLLSSLLLEKVGEVSFKKLQKKFVTEQFVGLQDATEVSAGFFDVFHLSEATIINAPKAVVDAASQFQPSTSQPKKQESQPVVYQTEIRDGRVIIDWNYLHDLLETYHIAGEEIDKNQKQISDLISFYRLNEQEFVRLAAITFTPGEPTLNMKQIKHVIETNYQTTDAVSTGLNQSKEIVSRNIQNLTAEDQKILELANKYPPIKFLEMIKAQKGGYVTVTERQVVYDLKNKQGLKDDLINILVKVALDSTATLSRAYVDRIANDWLQHQILTASEALSYVHERETKKQTKSHRYNYQSSNKKKEVATDWSKKKAPKPSYTTEELEALRQKVNKNTSDK